MARTEMSMPLLLTAARYLSVAISVLPEMRLPIISHLWTGSAWASLGQGVNDQVLALAVDGRGHLYAGGAFTQAGGQPANHIARWDGQQWETLGGGVNGYVNAIAVDGAGDVYVGGIFYKAGDVDVNCIAKWDGVSWSTLSGGVGIGTLKYGWVNALAVDRYGFVYAGGGFSADGGPMTANIIARWDGAQWTALGGGLQGVPTYDVYVNAIATDSRGNLYVGGRFSTAGGVPALNLARWNGETWSAVAGGIGSSNEKFPATVNSIIVDGGMVYVGGDFDLAGGLPVSGIAKWDGVSWDDLQGGVWQEHNYCPHSGDGYRSRWKNHCGRRIHISRRAVRQQGCRVGRNGLEWPGSQHQRGWDHFRHHF